MHNYKHRESTNVLELINYFKSYGYRSDGNDDETDYPSKVNFMTDNYKNSFEAGEAAGNNSYWGGTCISIARVVPGKTTKAFDNAYKGFIEKRKEYITFKNNLTIAYGRTSSKVTCPHCKSSINIQYGRWFKDCPVCHSKKIISDSNWKALETKKSIMIKGAEMLSREASKCGITFVAAIGWHS